MANEYGHHHWQDTYSPNPNEDKGGKGASGSPKKTNTSTSQDVSEDLLNSEYNKEVKNRQTDTFKK